MDEKAKKSDGNMFGDGRIAAAIAGALLIVIGLTDRNSGVVIAGSILIGSALIATAIRRQQ
jgi:hypothetical protein